MGEIHPRYFVKRGGNIDKLIESWNIRNINDLYRPIITRGARNKIYKVIPAVYKSLSLNNPCPTYPKEWGCLMNINGKIVSCGEATTKVIQS